MCLVSASVAYVCCNHWDLARWYQASTTKRSTFGNHRCQRRLMLTLSASGVLEKTSDPRTTPVVQRCPPPQVRDGSLFSWSERRCGGTTRGHPLRSGSPGGGGASSSLRARLETSFPPALAYTRSLRSAVLFFFCTSCFCSRLPHPLRRTSGVPHQNWWPLRRCWSLPWRGC